MMVGFSMSIVGVLMIAALSLWLTSAIRGDKLELNPVIGIRTARTTVSQEAWRAGHLAAIPSLQACTIIGFGTAAASVVLALVMPGPLNPGMVVIPLLGLVFQVIVMIFGTMKANTAAKVVVS